LLLRQGMVISATRVVTLLTLITLAGTFPVAAQQGVGHATGAVMNRAARAAALATIVGNALDQANGALPNSVVRVRDVMYGRIVASSLTNTVGAYSFKGLDPGNYIVELVTVGNGFKGLEPGPGNATLPSVQQAPLAATNLINVNPGQVVNTIVKLPKPEKWVNLLGNQPAPPPGGSRAIPAVVLIGSPISER
jgi:hypothetical protein